MTRSAEWVETAARMVGALIAVLGALANNPDAVRHVFRDTRASIRQAGRSTRGFLARVIPPLRRDATARAISAVAEAGVTAHSAIVARALVGWGAETSVEEKLDILDQRTRALDGEVGDLRGQVTQAEERLMAELTSAADQLNTHVTQVRADFQTYKNETVRTDARALPIVVLGVVVAGLAPEVAGLQAWAAVLMLLCALSSATVRAWRISMQSRGSAKG